ncbi:hypothetical protein [Natronocalculus amylovorans]|uniref:Uncharacterized protein n=1 Tax=Natronocalculus amylovorans TaxID=2917812 RepID=A0AAE3KAK6_9EURY|nr:hypothetical protein [Natronocalculus amylovorans]MCL9818380.1 hypothetical protein [Natronocalculus amylovorans]
MEIDDGNYPRKHKLVMYTSSGLLDQYFNRYSDDITKIIQRESISTTKELGGGVGNILVSLKGLIRKKSGKELIKEINLNDEHRQVRALMNIFSSSNLVYPVESLIQGEESPTGLYKFDTNLQLAYTENTEEKMIRARGIEKNVDFSGLTSPDNWSSRSFVMSALGTIDPFPFEGVFLPIETGETWYTETEEGLELEMLELTVQFLFILAPDTEDYIDWTSYQKLLRDHPKDIDQSGMEM